MSENEQAGMMNCAVARDLMPLYVENLTEEETRRLLREHVGQCSACAQKLDAQLARIKIKNKGGKQDHQGIKFLRKVNRKRLFLILLSLALAYVLLAGGYSLLFSWQGSRPDDVTIVGRYQLADGRIILAWTVKGVYPGTDDGQSGRPLTNHIGFSYSFSPSNGASYSFENDLGTIGTSNWNRWFTGPDDRGEIFYYLFDPEEAYDAEQAIGIGWYLNRKEEQSTKNTFLLDSICVNNYCLWQRGDRTRSVEPEEEAALLAAVERAQREDSSPRHVDEAKENELLIQLVREATTEQAK